MSLFYFGVFYEIVQSNFCIVIFRGKATYYKQSRECWSRVAVSVVTFESRENAGFSS